MSEHKTRIVPFEGKAKYLRLLAGVPETNGMKSAYVILQPQESVGGHSTEAKEEAIIVLEGMLQVFIEGNPFLTAKKDELLYIPARTLHDIKNIGESVARYIYVVSPVIKEEKC